MQRLSKATSHSVRSTMDETDRRIGRVAFGRRLLRMPEVLERTGVSKATIYRLIKAGKFPKPVGLGVRAVGWDAHAIDEWIEAREVAADFAETAGRGYSRFERRDRRPSETTTSVPKGQTLAREPGLSKRRRGTGTEADRKELAELDKKIARLIAGTRGYRPRAVDNGQAHRARGRARQTPQTRRAVDDFVAGSILLLEVNRLVACDRMGDRRTRRGTVSDMLPACSICLQTRLTLWLE